MLVLGMLVGCSSTPKTERSDLRDPYEHTNRKIFAFNMGVDSYVLEPVADGYRSNVPDAGRRAVDNHLDWAGCRQQPSIQPFKVIWKMRRSPPSILRSMV